MNDFNMANGVWLVTRNGQSKRLICKGRELNDILPFAQLMQYADKASKHLREYMDDVKEKTRRKMELPTGEIGEVYTVPSDRDMVKEVLFAVSKAHQERLIKESSDQINK